jgi:YegS/Rv2252/BmrU family lipid kinase
LKRLVIVNPRAADGQVARRWTAIEAKLRRALGDVDIRHTEFAGHATTICREAITRGVRDLLVLGGDGTLSEAVSGYFRDGRPIDKRASLGLLPLGTGGDFRRTLDLPTDLVEAARRVGGAATSPVDVGRLRFVGTDGRPAERYFINVASFGIGGLVDRFVGDRYKPLARILGGRAAFLAGTVHALAQYRNQRVRLRVDGGAPTEITINNVAVCNGRYFGGGMNVAPDARIDDGRFDVVIFGDLGLKDFVAQGRHLYRGTHLALDRVHHRSATSLEAEPVVRQDVLLDVDGEQPGRLPARFDVLPGALSFRC